jgi:uncharacterized membrane protein YwaF
MNHEANTMYRMKSLDRKIPFGLAAALIVGAGSALAQQAHPVTVAISFNGFGAAFDALAKK